MTNHESTNVTDFFILPYPADSTNLEVDRNGRKPYEASLKMDENYRIEMTFRDIPVERQPLPAGDPSVMQAADIPVETPHPGQLP